MLSKTEEQIPSYRTQSRKENQPSQNTEEKIKESIALVELTTCIEKSINSGTVLFKLSELHSMYVNRLENMGVNKMINKTDWRVTCWTISQMHKCSMVAETLLSSLKKEWGTCWRMFWRKETFQKMLLSWPKLPQLSEKTSSITRDSVSLVLSHHTVRKIHCLLVSSLSFLWLWKGPAWRKQTSMTPRPAWLQLRPSFTTQRRGQQREVGQYSELVASHPDAHIWVAFGMGKSFCYYSINNIISYLGEQWSQALPVFYAFTGCDQSSAFCGKEKKSAWQAWQAYEEKHWFILLVTPLSSCGKSLTTSSLKDLQSYCMT